MKVYLIGAGMGNVDTLTVGALRAIQESDLIIGAKRLLQPFDELECKKLALVKSDQIVEAIEDAQASQVSVLLSGDLGFYSGAKGLYDKLADALSGCDVETIPGISSVAYFCSKLQTTWQDVTLVSAHGRTHDAVGAIQSNEKTFCLVGGKTKVQDICRQLVRRGLGGLRVAAGERLSYEDERIVQGTAKELSKMEFSDLSVLLAWNPHPVQRSAAAPALPDAAFERGPKTPMTKEEVRALAIAKLRIEPGHKVWDVGAGTGSVSVEAALAANRGMVYSVERDDAALELLEANKAAHGVTNMRIVAGAAPDALDGLPAPDRVFVGGTSGKLEEIVSAVLSANPQARICVAAVTLDTLVDVMGCVWDHEFEDVDIVQVSVARADEVGSYHLMRAENPVYLATMQHPQES